MVKGGYRIVDKQTDAAKADGIPWLTEDFELDADSPDDLGVFFHVSFSFKSGLPGTPQKILMTKDGTDFTPLNNNGDVDGWFYRSDMISKGDKLNFKVVGTGITLSNFILTIED